MIKIAIDIGGTFTDGVLENARTGACVLAKSLTTYPDPGIAVSTVVQSLLEQLPAADRTAPSDIVHGTTLVTNAVIERKGARTVIVLTEGTRDVPELRRENRYDIYDLDLAYPAPLATPDARVEVQERLGSDGSIVTPLTPAEVARVVVAVQALRPEAVAICLLHAYVNEVHETALEAAIAAALPSIAISRSSAVAREIREFERMSTVTANAFVQPLTAEYLRRLRTRFDGHGVTGPLRIMVSSGGFTSSDAAAAFPIRILESGPAAGVLSAINTGAVAGLADVLAFDMGGTTAKACVAVGSRALVTNHFEAGRAKRFKKGSGLPLVVPSIDLIEIGAGGGSIARVGEMGLLKVGPESAGSQPGPACYGRGGVEPTVTDADLVLGYLDPEYFLGGTMRLDVGAAHEAIDRLSTALGMAPADLAFGIVNVVNENMAGAARVHIAEKGFDPKRFAMVATGGAGPVHAVEVARKLRLHTILCSMGAGNGSCLGLLVAPARIDRSWSRIESLDSIDWSRAQATLDALHADACRELSGAGAALDSVGFDVAVEMRYVGQGATVIVTMELAPLADRFRPAALAMFEAEYTRLFGRTVPEATVEVVTWRLVGEGRTHSRGFDLVRAKDLVGNAAPSAMRRAYLPDQRAYADVPVYDRQALPIGTALQGPAILQEPESTIVVARDATITILPDRSVRIELPE